MTADRENRLKALVELRFRPLSAKERLAVLVAGFPFDIPGLSEDAADEERALVEKYADIVLKRLAPWDGM